MTLFLGSKNTDEGTSFTAVVTVVTDSQEHAEQVLAERLLHDEDYGFEYTVNYGDLQPEKATRGIILDASFVREELNDLVENTYRPLIQERVKNLSNAQINTIISEVRLDDFTVWEAFDTIRSQIVTAVINAVTFQWTADDEARLRLLESYGDALTNDETDELNDLMWRYAHSCWGLETLTDTVDEDA